MNGDWSFDPSSAVSSLWGGANEALNQITVLGRSDTKKEKKHGKRDASPHHDTTGDVERASVASSCVSSSSRVALNELSPRLSREGWLWKRGPMESYKWKRYWFVLNATSVGYFGDETCKEKKGEISIRQGSRIGSFKEDGAPGDAPKYKSERPAGFFVDVDPSANAMMRQIHYLEAEGGEAVWTMEDWVRKIGDAAKKAPPVAKAKIVAGFLEVPGGMKEVKTSIRNRGVTSGRQTAPCPHVAESPEAIEHAEACELEIKNLREALGNAKKDAEEATASASFAEQFIIQDAEAVSERAITEEREARQEAVEAQRSYASARKELSDKTHEIDLLISARARMRAEMTDAVGEAMDRVAAATSQPRGAQLVLQESQSENMMLRVELQAAASEKASMEAARIALERLLEAETAQARDAATMAHSRSEQLAMGAEASQEQDAELCSELNSKVKALEAASCTSEAEREECNEEMWHAQARATIAEEGLEEKAEECTSLELSYRALQGQVAMLVRHNWEFKREAREARSETVWDSDRDDSLLAMEKELDEQRKVMLSELSQAQKKTQSAEQVAQNVQKEAKLVAQIAEAKAASAKKAVQKKHAPPKSSPRPGNATSKAVSKAKAKPK